MLTAKAILAALLLMGAPRSVAAELAPAIGRHASTPAEAAFLITWAKYESSFSPEIAAGICARWQCDAHARRDGSVDHLARGLFQLHRGAAGRDWDLLAGNIDIQTRAAAKIARFAYGQCRTGDRVRGAFRVLAGLRCTGRPFKSEDERVATYARAFELVKP